MTKEASAWLHSSEGAFVRALLNDQSQQDARDLADAKIDQDDTRAQLKSDEEFFEATKEGCKMKAGEWVDRFLACALRS